jgi:hypothetical protein
MTCSLPCPDTIFQRPDEIKKRTDKNNSPTRKKSGKNAPDSFFSVTVTASKQTKQSKNKGRSRRVAVNRGNLKMKIKKNRRG